METSEELEWELYDIFISGIFAFPIYEHNAARRIVRYLLMRGVLDEEIANAIEGPTVDLRIWLNRGGKHLVGEWVIAWLNDSRDQYKNRRRRAGLRGRSRLQDRRIFYRDRDDDVQHEEGSPFSVHSYLSSSATHRSSFSSDSNDSRWTKEEDESDISSDYELEEEVDDEDLDVEEAVDARSVQRRSSIEVEDEPRRPRGGRPRDSQTPLEILVESSTDCCSSVPHYKLHRPQTLNLDPDALSLMRCPTGSWALDAPDSGHVSDTQCSCLLLPCLDPSSSPVHNDDCHTTYDDHTPSMQAIRADDDFTSASVTVHCSACHSNLTHYASHVMCAVCRNDVVAMDTADAASEDGQRCHEVTTA